MAIQRSTFSGWYLTGEDATAFKKLISNLPPNPLADAAFRRGKGMAEEFARTGRVTIKVDKKGRVITEE